MIFDWTYENNVLKLWNLTRSMGAEIPLSSYFMWRFVQQDWNILGEAKRPIFRLTIDGRSYQYEDELGVALFALSTDHLRGKYRNGRVEVQGDTWVEIVHGIRDDKILSIHLPDVVNSRLVPIKFFRLITGSDLKTAKEFCDQATMSFTDVPYQWYEKTGVDNFLLLMKDAPFDYDVRERNK